MVVSLTGRCNGQDIIFRQNEAGQWETAVPADRQNMYVIELYATDDAGNVSYFATVKITFDPSTLCMKVEILDVGAGFTIRDVMEALSSGGVQCRPILTEFSARAEADVVRSKIIRCEVCGL